MDSALESSARAGALMEFYRSCAATEPAAAAPREILDALLDLDVVDQVRGMTREGDRSLILRLARSNRRDDRLAAHILGRRFVHGTLDPEVFEAFEEAYTRAVVDKDLVLQLSYFHDLLEDPEFATKHKGELVDLARSRRAEVRDVIIQYSQGDEQVMLEALQERLCGVLTSEESSRYNAHGKAFMYALYLGCIVDAGRRERARQTLEDWRHQGDLFFQSVAKSEIEYLRSETQGVASAPSKR